MPGVRVNWSELAGRELSTVTGAPFKVVRVSATHVAIRPKRGSRDYALSIPRELEPAVSAFAESRRLPIPSDLQLMGVREVLLSYAWGILKAVVVDRIGLRVVRQWKLRDFAGDWQITDLPDIGHEYAQQGEAQPSIALEYRSSHASVSGEYDIGLSSGSIDGELREFGGEQVLIYGYEGADEMEPASGGGWMRLAGADTLEGEFMGSLGRFSAVRRRLETAAKPKAKRRAVKSKPGVVRRLPKTSGGSPQS